MKEIKQMKGTVKFFNVEKGYGFITGEDGADHFVHYSSLNMDGFKMLSEGDIVDYEIGVGTTGKEQAVNVTPILTEKMINNTLKEENLHLETMKDTYSVTKYLVVNENNILQSSEQGMSLIEAAAYAGFDVEGLED